MNGYSYFHTGASDWVNYPFVWGHPCTLRVKRTSTCLIHSPSEPFKSQTLLPELFVRCCGTNKPSCTTMLALELCLTPLKQEWFKSNQRFVLWVRLKGKEGDKKCDVPKSAKSLEFQAVACKSKEMDERHANSTFSQGVHWGKGFSFIKTHCYHRPKIGEALGEPGRNSRRRRIPEIGSNYWHTKSFAVITGG